MSEFTLEDCTLGDNFSIVSPSTNISVALNKINLINNKIDPNLVNTLSNLSSLFSGGEISTQDVLIKGN